MADISNIQKRFVAKALAEFKGSLFEFAHRLGVHPRTLGEYREGRYRLNAARAKQIEMVSGVVAPKGLPSFDQKKHLVSISRKGGKGLIAKYSRVPVSETVRKQAWVDWWERKGRHEKRFKHTMKTPEHSARLAELAGIILGDGGIGPYQITVTLSKEERAYSSNNVGHFGLAYAKYVQTLSKDLFGIPVSLHNREGHGACDVRISSRECVLFFMKECGFSVGSKIASDARIPEWIMANQEYRKACLRGALDTDGCIFLETHSSYKNRKYSYARLNITIYIPGLVEQLYEILSSLDLHPKIRRGGKAVQLENLDEICKYMEVVGSSNPQRHRQYKRILEGCQSGRMR